MSKSFSLIYAIVQTICVSVIVLCVLAAFYSIGPRLETVWWPVVTKLQVDRIEETPEGWTKIQAGFTKLRDCEFVGLAWFKGNRPYDFERVPVVLQREPQDIGSPNRPLGTQRAGPWLIGVSPKDFETKTFAQLWHRCHPFWTTVTEFYP